MELKRGMAPAIIALLSLSTFTAADHENSTGTMTTTSTTAGTTDASSSVPTDADIYLNVPELHVGRLELDVEDLTANINLAAQVAGLVNINAGIQLGASKINLSIQDLDAQLELVVNLDKIVAILNRTLESLESLDANPNLVGLLSGLESNVTSTSGASSVVSSTTEALCTATSVLSSVVASATSWEMKQPL